MRYLRTNEAEAKTQREMQDSFIQEVQEFSRELLAYLIDEGCSITFSTLSFNHGLVLKFNPSMSWKSIDNYIIPFYEVLKETYYLANNEGMCDIKFEAGSGEFNIETGELLNYRTVVMNDESIKQPLDSLTEIRIRFDSKRIYGKFDYERFKRL